MEILKGLLLLAMAYGSYRFWRYMTDAQAFSKYAYMKIPFRLRLNFSCICMALSAAIGFTLYFLWGQQQATLPAILSGLLILSGLCGIFTATGSRRSRNKGHIK